MSQYDPNNQPNPYGALPGAQPINDKRTLGLWALWTGIASVVIGPILFGVLSIPPIVLGIIALIREPRSKSLGIWGIVLGVIAFVWMIVFWAVAATWFTVFLFGTFMGELPSPSY